MCDVRARARASSLGHYCSTAPRAHIPSHLADANIADSATLDGRSADKGRVLASRVLNSATRPTPTSGRRHGDVRDGRSAARSTRPSILARCARARAHCSTSRVLNRATRLTRSQQTAGAIRSTAARLTSDQRCEVRARCERERDRAHCSTSRRVRNRAEPRHAHTAETARHARDGRSADRAASIRAKCASERSARELIGVH